MARVMPHGSAVVHHVLTHTTVVSVPPRLTRLLLRCLCACLQHLRHLAKVVTEARQLKLLSDSHVTTMQLVQANSANERTQSTLWMM